MNKNRDFALVYINGVENKIKGPDLFMMLADFLRYQKNQTGTKIVCAEGDCGACSVLKLDQHGNYVAINSCIINMAQLDGANIVTVEGLSHDEGKSLSDVQQSIVDHHATQCGFCTSGFAVTLTALAEKGLKFGQDRLQKKEVQNALTGNLCRCTGYTSLLEAGTDLQISKYESLKKRFTTKQILQSLKQNKKSPLLVKSDEVDFYAPTVMKDAVRFLTRNRQARIIAAGTDLGVLVNKGKLTYDKLLSLHLIEDLSKIKKRSGKVYVGAGVTLACLQEYLHQEVPEFFRFLELFASPQIKNVATLIGNIANASPIGDTAPFLLVMEARLYLQGPKGKRILPLEEFFLGYKKTALKTAEIIVGIEFKLPLKRELLCLKKASQRKHLDISTLNFAGSVGFDRKGRVEKIRLAMGGIAPYPMRLKKVENFLEGKELNSAVLSQSAQILQEEISPISDLRGSSTFRRILAERYFREFLLSYDHRLSECEL